MDCTVTSLWSILKKSGQTMYLAGIGRVYKATVSHSPLRVYTSHCLAHTITACYDGPFDYTETPKITEVMMGNKDLANDTLQRMRGISKNLSNPLRLPICTFHTHGQEEERTYPLEH